MHMSTRVRACNATDKRTQKATENINQMLADDSIVMVDLDINSCCQKDPFLAFPYFRHTGSRNSKNIPRHGGDGVDARKQGLHREISKRNYPSNHPLKKHSTTCSLP